MSYECVPLYDTLGENAVEYIINHSEAVVVVADGRKLASLAGAVKGINTAQFKNVVYWGQEDAAAVQVGVFCSKAFVVAAHTGVWGECATPDGC
jgi:long-chain acyl-CoA synthetase